MNAFENLWKKIGFYMTFPLCVASGFGVLYTISIRTTQVATSELDRTILSHWGYFILVSFGLTVVLFQWSMEEFAKLLEPNEPVVPHDIGGDEALDIPTFLEPERLQMLRDEVRR